MKRMAILSECLTFYPIIFLKYPWKHWTYPMIFLTYPTPAHLCRKLHYGRSKAGQSLHLRRKSLWWRWYYLIGSKTGVIFMLNLWNYTIFNNNALHKAESQTIGSSCWMLIVPVLKKGDPTKTETYRGIVLTVVLSKTLNMMILNRTAPFTLHRVSSTPSCAVSLFWSENFDKCIYYFSYYVSTQHQYNVPLTKATLFILTH